MTLKCKNCLEEIDSHTGPDGGSVTPKDGDLSICLYCGYLGTFKKGRIAPLSQEEYLALDEATKAEISKVEAARKFVMAGGLK